MKKVVKTPYKDLNGETIKVGDVIVFGLLGQHWKVSQVKKIPGAKKYWPPLDSFLATIISKDSGVGHWEMMEGMDFGIPENQTYICKEGCYTT